MPLARAKGILAVEMEAAALYTFARTHSVAAICLAHVTNTMGLANGDFEKGEADGTADALMILDIVAKAMVSRPEQFGESAIVLAQRRQRSFYGDLYKARK